MSLDDLSSVLELGWQSSREAWQLLAPNDDGDFTTTGADATGRAMDKLAYDLRRVGFIKPARLAYSAAFVLNSLADQSITFDQELAEKTSQIVSVLAEMLLELEANQEITVSEPTEIVEELQSTWGLEFEDDDAPELLTPQDQDRDDPDPEEADSALVANSEELVSASGSLLERVLREGDFPHTATLGRIHHLASLIRDQVIFESQPRQGTEPLGYAEELRSMAIFGFEDSVPQLIAEQNFEGVEGEDEELPEIDACIAEPIVDLQPRVLILDPSPFFRMLLTSAVESAGYQAFATGVLPDVVDDSSWNMIICGLDNLTESSRQMLERLVAATNAGLIVLDQVESASQGAIPLRRADITGLLRALESQLGTSRVPVQKSA